MTVRYNSLKAFSELAAPSSLHELSRRINAERALPDITAKWELITELLRAAVFKAHRLPTAQDRLSAIQPILSSCFTLKSAEVVEQLLQSLPQDLRVLDRSEDTLKYASTYINPLLISLQDHLLASKYGTDPASVALIRKAVRDVQDVVFDAHLDWLQVSVAGLSDYMVTDHYKKHMRPLTLLDGGLSTLLERYCKFTTRISMSSDHLSFRAIQPARLSTHPEAILRFLIAVRSDKQRIVDSSDFKPHWELLVASYARQAALRTTESVFRLILRCVDNDLEEVVQLVAQRVADDPGLIGRVPSESSVAVYDNCSKPPHFEDENETEEFCLDGLLLKIQTSCPRKSKDKLAPALRTLLLAWMERILGPPPQGTTLLQRRIDRIKEQWWCDRPACTLVRKFLLRKPSGNHSRTSTIKILALGPRVLSHLKHDLEAYVPGDIATWTAEDDGSIEVSWCTILYTIHHDPCVTASGRHHR